MLTKNFLAKIFLLLAFAAASATLLAPSQAQAEAYFMIELECVQFIDGDKIKFVTNLSSSGDRDGIITRVDMYSVELMEDDGNILWNNAAEYDQSKQHWIIQYKSESEDC